MLKSIALAAAVLAMCRAHTPQASRGLGRISGQVTSITSQPIKGARVRLTAVPRSAAGVQNPILEAYNTTSDAAGNFTFESISAGQYQLSADHGGYLRSAGSRNGRTVDLDAGQSLNGVELELTPEGRIEGTVTDEDGEPAPQARVLVLRWAAANGLKRLVDGGSSNQGIAPDGSFVSSGLEAGLYYICAEVERSNDAPRGRSAHEAYVPTFYPGVADSTAAGLIKVETGAVIRGVNIRLQRAAVHRFRGTAVDNRTNAPTAGVRLDLLPASLPMTLSRSADTQEDGSFDFGALPQGEYTVRVGYARPPAPGQPARLSTAPIVIGNRDVEDAVLRMMPAIEVDGKVALADNRGSRTPPNLRVVLSSAAGSEPFARVGRDSTFVIRDVGPDRYLPTIAGLSPGTYVKAIRFGNEDVTGRAIDLTSGVGGTLEIVLGPNAAQVNGLVQDSKGNPVPEVQVSLWKPGQTSFTGVFAPLATVTNASGAFAFASLPPGEYRVAAWADPAAVLAPEFLSHFHSAAAAITLQEGSRQAVQAPMIPQDAIESALRNLR